MIETAAISQRVYVPIEPHAVYETWVDSRRHSALTGLPCAIDARPNGEFRVGENLIEGTFLELLPAQRIIQTWKIAAYGWPADHFSTLHLELRPERLRTVITLEQRDVPRACLPIIEAGWDSYYWQPMAASSLPTSPDGASAP